MVIIPLLVIELKATGNGNPSNAFYLALSMLCNIKPPLVYGIRLSPNDYVLVLCFGMPFQEVPLFPFSIFDFLRLPGQYSIMIE